jgi:hypothetical protein
MRVRPYPGQSSHFWSDKRPGNLIRLKSPAERLAGFVTSLLGAVRVLHLDIRTHEVRMNLADESWLGRRHQPNGARAEVHHDRPEAIQPSQWGRGVRQVLLG